jgi:three-Cys-motif partner protein
LFVFRSLLCPEFTGRYLVEATTVAKGHRFGGAWTELKLDMVHYYLGFFTRVLRTKPFDLWYIDAFAGSGRRTVEHGTGELLNYLVVLEKTSELAGSVIRALEVDPPFSRHVFIEGNEARFRELEAIRTNRPEKKIVCRHGDANTELRTIFTPPPWGDQVAGRGILRAVAFLDPYGMNVEWDTLRLLADTMAVDVWYLFPMLAVTRQLAKDIARVDQHKSVRLDAIFGTTNWREELYDTVVINDLFEPPVTTSVRNVTLPQIEEYARNRLATLFRYVSPSLPLIADGRGQLFSLFCLSNSASHAAIELIEKGVKATLKKYGGAASRRTYGH